MTSFRWFVWACIGILIQSIAALFVPGGYLPIWSAHALRASRGLQTDEAWLWVGIEWLFWLWKDLSFLEWFGGISWLVLCVFLSRTFITARGRMVWVIWCSLVLLGLAFLLLVSRGGISFSLSSFCAWVGLIWWCLRPVSTQRITSSSYAMV